MKLVNIFFLLSCLVFASNGSNITTKHYIVYMGQQSSPNSNDVIDSNIELFASVVGGNVDEAKSSIIHHYHKSFRGFSALLTPEQANLLSNDSSVVSVFESTSYHLQTTRSWNFMQQFANARPLAKGLYKQFRDRTGRQTLNDVIVGHFDSGVWPESKSFADRGLGPAPKYFKGNCTRGPKWGASRCNRKIIGARYYYAGYEASNGALEYYNNNRTYFKSARDDSGHGTHTASIAVGAKIRNVSISGILENKVAIGGSPHARLAVYKLCWFNICDGADILKAYDDAIADGVDIITFSAAPDSKVVTSYFEDPFSIGSYHAFTNRILVVASGGNYGKVVNVAPWILTVAASTIDREFVAYVSLGNQESLRCSATNQHLHLLNGSYGVISGRNAKAGGVPLEQASYCKDDTLNHTLIGGKIVVCFLEGLEDNGARKAEVVRKGGGVGLIVIDGGSFREQRLVRDYVIPTVILGNKEARRLQVYLSEEKNPTATISETKTLFQTTCAPKMAFFSAKGPNSITPDIIKPDITAPGLNILGASITTHRNQAPDAVAYSFGSGTSMSTPHVAGVAAILQAINKRWSPAAIKSALMTTAYLFDDTGDLIQAGDRLATPFDYGSGHLHPDQAFSPGLVYEFDTNDLTDFLCYHSVDSSRLGKVIGHEVDCNYPLVSPYQLNYPSISIASFWEPISVERSVTLVAKRAMNDSAVYRVAIEHPEGTHVHVEPPVLDFTNRNKANFTVSISPLVSSGWISGCVYGSITWTDGSHNVRSPIVVGFQT